jgi:hypothetical protein
MNTPLRVLLPTAILLLGAFAQPARAQEDERPAEPAKPAHPIDGSWRWNFTMPDGTVTRPKLILAVENGALTGTTSFRYGNDAPITNAVLNGDQLRFQIVRQRDGQDIVTTYEGKWSEKEIKGKIQSNWGGDIENFEWLAARAHIGAEGTWQWTNTFGGFGRGGGGRGDGDGDGQGGRGNRDQASDESSTNRTQTAAGDRPRGDRDGGGGGRGGGRGGRGFVSRVELEQNGEALTGSTVPSRSGRSGRSFGGRAPIKNGTIKNGEIYFEIVREFGETKFVSKYRGKQTGDVIKGTTEFTGFDGEERTNSWHAIRVD